MCIRDSVEVEEGIDGLIHISDMSWTKHIKHPSELFKKAQRVEAVILRIDKEKERLSLGYKQLTPDPWETDIPSRYQVESTASGTIVKIADFGVFVELDGNVEGLIHISESGQDSQDKLEETFKIGDVIVAKVVKVDCEERKIALSVREYSQETNSNELETFNDSQGDTDQSLGRIAQDKEVSTEQEIE